MAMELACLESPTTFRAYIDQRARGTLRLAGVADLSAVADQQNVEFEHMPRRDYPCQQIMCLLGRRPARDQRQTNAQPMDMGINRQHGLAASE